MARLPQLPIHYLFRSKDSVGDVDPSLDQRLLLLLLNRVPEHQHKAIMNRVVYNHINTRQQSGINV